MNKILYFLTILAISLQLSIFAEPPKKAPKQEPKKEKAKKHEPKKESKEEQKERKDNNAMKEGKEELGE